MLTSEQITLLVDILALLKEPGQTQKYYENLTAAFSALVDKYCGDVIPVYKPTYVPTYPPYNPWYIPPITCTGTTINSSSG